MLVKLPNLKSDTSEVSKDIASQSVKFCHFEGVYQQITFKICNFKVFFSVVSTVHGFSRTCQCQKLENHKKVYSYSEMTDKWQ